MRSSALVRFTGGLAASLLVLTLLGASSASADDTPLPIAVNDTISLYPFQIGQLNVLANDTSPSGDDLDVCRFPLLDLSGATPPPVQAVVLGILGNNPGDLMVVTESRTPGTYGIDYYICDHVHLVPAHLDVTILPVAPVVVRKVSGKSGVLRVTNKNTASVRFSFGHPKALRADGAVRIAAGATRLVTVRRHTIAWTAEIGSKTKGSQLSTLGFADEGVVRGIKLKPGRELPPPKHPAG